jgi:hypothetical protein
MQCLKTSWRYECYCLVSQEIANSVFNLYEVCTVFNQPGVCIPSHMGGDMVVATVGTSASHNILQHPSISLIEIHHKYQGSSGICRIGIGIKLQSSGSNEACLCTPDFRLSLDLFLSITNTSQEAYNNVCNAIVK